MTNKLEISTGTTRYVSVFKIFALQELFKVDTFHSKFVANSRNPSSTRFQRLLSNRVTAAHLCGRNDERVRNWKSFKQVHIKMRGYLCLAKTTFMVVLKSELREPFTKVG